MSSISGDCCVANDGLSVAEWLRESDSMDGKSSPALELFILVLNTLIGNGCLKIAMVTMIRAHRKERTVLQVAPLQWPQALV